MKAESLEEDIPPVRSGSQKPPLFKGEVLDYPTLQAGYPLPGSRLSPTASWLLDISVKTSAALRSTFGQRPKEEGPLRCILVNY